jgi:hypothetical protein
VSSIGRPVHSIDLGEMSFQRLLRLHHLVLWEGVLLRLRNAGDYKPSA